MKRFTILAAVAAVTVMAAAIGIASAAPPPPGTPGPVEVPQTNAPGHDGASPQVASPGQAAAGCLDWSVGGVVYGDLVTYTSNSDCEITTELAVYSSLWRYDWLIGWWEVAHTEGTDCGFTNICWDGDTIDVNPGRYYTQGTHYCGNCNPDPATTYSPVFIVS